MANLPPVREPRHALWELTVARIREMLRDPTALFWTFGFPVFLAVVLGLATSSAPLAPQPVGLVCTAAAAGCESIRARLRHESRIALRESALPEALRGLRRSKLDLVLEIQGAAGAPQLVYHFDPSRREARSARLAVDDGLYPRRPEFASHDAPRTERGGRYIDFLMPGIVAMNLMGSCVWGIGFTIVEARRRKLLRQLAATPMKRAHFLLSYMFSRLVFLVPEVVVLFAFGVLAFDTPIQGNLASLAVLSLAGAFAFTGLGVLIAAREDSSEAAAGWANVVLIPMSLFSGVFFSYELYPEALLPLIRALPLTALIDAFRAITNEGASLAACAIEFAVLSAWAVISFVVALKSFRWQ
jgi:ABC-2 type transport system permease protein